METGAEVKQTDVGREGGTEDPLPSQPREGGIDFLLHDWFSGSGGFQIAQSRLHVAVCQPSLDCSYVDTVLQPVGGRRRAELVQVPASANRMLLARQPLPRRAMPAIQPGLERNLFQVSKQVSLGIIVVVRKCKVVFRVLGRGMGIRYSGNSITEPTAAQDPSRFAATIGDGANNSPPLWSVFTGT